DFLGPPARINVINRDKQVGDAGAIGKNDLSLDLAHDTTFDHSVHPVAGRSLAINAIDARYSRGYPEADTRLPSARPPHGIVHLRIRLGALFLPPLRTAASAVAHV